MANNLLADKNRVQYMLENQNRTLNCPIFLPINEQDSGDEVRLMGAAQKMKIDKIPASANNNEAHNMEKGFRIRFTLNKENVTIMFTNKPIVETTAQILPATTFSQGKSAAQGTQDICPNKGWYPVTFMGPVFVRLMVSGVVQTSIIFLKTSGCLSVSVLMKIINTDAWKKVSKLY